MTLYVPTLCCDDLLRVPPVTSCSTSNRRLLHPVTNSGLIGSAQQRTVPILSAVASHCPGGGALPRHGCPSHRADAVPQHLPEAPSILTSHLLSFCSVVEQETNNKHHVRMEMLAFVAVLLHFFACASSLHTLIYCKSPGDDNPTQRQHCSLHVYTEHTAYLTCG